MIRFVALFLTTLTGFTGLVYEVLWQRYLASLLGSHSEATAAVLAIFLGGLACGYALFGRLAQALARRTDRGGRPSSVLIVYGIVEAAIGVYAFAFPALFAGARAISLSLPIGSETGAFALDIAMTALLIGPPTVLMGGTIPLLTQGLASGLADATRFHALVYACNTAGAFLGAVAGGFLLLPWLGLKNATFAMGVINLFAGIAFLALGARRSAAAIASVGNVQASGSVQGFAAYAAVALLGGFAMMALQTTFNRIGALALGASYFTFAIVVAVFVLCIAIGSMAVSAFSRIPRAALVVVVWSLVAYLLLLYPHVGDAPYWAHVVRAIFRSEDAAFYPYHLEVLAGIFIVLLVPLALSGAMLPLLFHHLRTQVDDLGAVAGRLYSWNTSGSLLGALLPGYALLFWLDLHHIYHLAVASLALAAAIVSTKTFERGWMLAAVGLVAALTAAARQPAWIPERLSAGLFRSPVPTPVTYAGPTAFFESTSDAQRPSFLFYDDDPIASVAVAKYAREEKSADRSILVNGKSDGHILLDQVTMRMLALLPLLLADRAERAFVIGYGTGTTIGELADHPGMQEVVVAEIAPAVMSAAVHFEDFNGRVLENPKVDIVRSDAYRALLHHAGTYDVIVSEPSNPWVMGVETLMAKEFFDAARARLRPGGVYCQWFHTYAMNASTIALVFNTFRQAFPRSSVWFSVGNDIILIGFEDDDGEDELERLVERWSSDNIGPHFERLGIDSIPGLLAHEILPVGVITAAELPDAVHTLLHPILSYKAARAFFHDGDARFPSTLTRDAATMGARNSLLRRYRAGLSDEEWSRARPSFTAQACMFDSATCMTFLADWMRVEPEAVAINKVFSQAKVKYGGTEIDATLLPHLAKLFDASGTSDLPPTYEYAESVAKLFLHAYAHALPFDAGALHGPWQRCAAAGDERCRERLAQIDALGVELGTSRRDHPGQPSPRTVR